ncbi:MAG: D-alanine--D-alanine ligase [Nevskia sp.]
MRKRSSNPKDFGKVGVLMGGWSSERQVSLWSGEGVVAALRNRGVDATPVDADKDTILTLPKLGFDRVFNLLHGTGGEDGTVQAVLDLHGIPYPGCGVLASALAMDKLRTKRIWKAEGLPTPDYRVLKTVADGEAAAEAFGYPFIIKPTAEGSSVGVTKVKHAAQIDQALADALGATNRAVMAERFVAGGEYTCAMLDGQALPLIRIEPASEFYDYHAKYISNDTRYICPADLVPTHEQELQAICAKAFELIGGRGWGRVDFMLDVYGKPWLIEVNTVPGMTSHSLVPMAARAVGVDYDALCWAILETTLPEDPSA